MIMINKKIKKGWRVYYEGVNGRPGKLIDIVFFDITMNSKEVKRSLIEHDNFPNDIIVLEDRGI